MNETFTTTMQAKILSNTPTTEQLAEMACLAMIETMGESLERGKHGEGSWNEGAEANPKWHLTRVIRHANQAIMLLDGLDHKDLESIQVHTRNALARCCLAYAQLGGTK